MFCYQCQETAKNTGCTVAGVCGKKEDVANMQDLLIFVLKGISIYSTKARELGIENEKANKLVFDGLFMTITNANFDKDRFIETIREGLKLREEIKDAYIKAGGTIPDNLHEAATWTGNTVEEFEVKNGSIGVLATENEDIRSLRELVIYGLKGLAAYVEHAFVLGYVEHAIYTFMQKALADTTNDNLGADELVALVLETGKYGVDGMALLDKANTTTYGNPEISKVNIGVSDKPGILISGHDLKDMEDLLKQTEGTGIDVYTHGEMLPANYYPELKKYSHFIGNYGNAWWQQKEEFESFNGPILFTTNCIVPPSKKATYANRVFTTGSSGYPGFIHIADRKDGKPKDFSKIIELAKTCKAPVEIEKGEIIGGFAHNQVIKLADKIVDAIKSGAIKKFFVMAGCDGRHKTRSYYTEFAEQLPKETVILTAGCAKYRYNKLNLGDINGIPRVLDAGQCNDSYSLVVIALKLKEVFELDDINELPIEFNIAWYEQKAVIVLLALLYLGVKNIHLGPTLPAFLSPNVVKVLVDTFGIAGIGKVEDDIKMFMNL
jgi:hydroxylamine reductase